MKYAIIAAGEGSRLSEEGINVPKPLIKVNGETLVDRLIRIFIDNEATEIVIVCNDMTTIVSEHLHRIEREGLNGCPVHLRVIVKSTPSSMHSFFEISEYLKDEPFCLTTVDTIFKIEEFKQYISSFKIMVSLGKSDGLMGVTDYIDDEKPLYIGTDDDMKITGFYDTPNDCRYISGGIYGLTPSSILTLQKCINRGESRMRNFQRALVADGLCLNAYPFKKILDIDHADDICKAENFLAGK
jgi:NDP-sugar pyrophosphorylase family protein